MFEIFLKKVTKYDYKEVILQFQLLDKVVNTLRISNVSWTCNLGHNLFSTIPLFKKKIKIFLKKTNQSSKIFFKNEVVEMNDMIEN